MKQARVDSFMEALTNVAVGFAINFAANVVILPAVLGVPVNLAALGLIGALYTLISVARSYAIRRLFNGRSIWQAIKGRPVDEIALAEQCMIAAGELLAIARRIRKRAR